MTGPARPRKLRKRYANPLAAVVFLRFEDGHEIRIPRGEGRAFDCWAGETVTIVAAWDPTIPERELVERRRAEDFDDDA